MGRGHVCGAVSAGLLVLGLMGPEPSEAGDKAPRREVMIRGQSFLDRFAGRRGSIICNDLLGLDLSTPQGHAEAVERELFATLCPCMVEEAARLLEEMAMETGAKAD